MRFGTRYLFLVVIILNMAMAKAGPISIPVQSSGAKKDSVKLENPFSVAYLKSEMRKSHPRLVLTPSIEKNLKEEIKTNPVVKNYYEAIKINAEKIQTQPLLNREVVGLRLLATSREMLYRMGILGMVYRIEKDPDVLNRIDQELKAVCNFSDWNPSHYLDVAEMAMAVALAVDWVGVDLPKSTVDLAKSSLIEKGIKPSYLEEGERWWVNGTNNWNQVCHAGMVAASIVIAERNPELAAKTIGRALDGMPHALTKYGPDGIYPEGPTYWAYGTSFSVMTSSMLESAFNTDFGLADYPAFKQSAVFRVLMEAPSGLFFNFADSGDRPSKNGDVTLAWFAKEEGDPLYLEEEKFLQAPELMGKLPRLAGPGLVWLSQLEIEQKSLLPLTWAGEGSNPVVILRGGRNDPGKFYFGGKGGSADVSHGNMDAGSFIYELDGVRWVIDPGNQPYHELERTGFDLWDYCRECDRWTLLTKNNFGHSTITVNDALHMPEGYASLIDYKSGEHPEATFDMSPVLGSGLERAERRFVKESDRSLLVEDQIKTNDSTQKITWQLMTQADVEIVNGGAILRQSGEQLRLEILSHPQLMISVISLDPAPLELDRKIEGLKRLEINIPAWTIKDGRDTIQVRLYGE